MKKSRNTSSMPLYRIRTFGDPTLRDRARPVTEFDEQLMQLIDTMFELMDQADGVGLAATQIGVQKQIAVWRHPESEERYVLVNPRFLDRSAGDGGGKRRLPLRARVHAGCAAVRAGHGGGVRRRRTVLHHGR